MGDIKSPSWRSRLLGRELRMLRRDKGFKASDLAVHLGCGASSVVRVERGEYPASLRELDQILDICGVTDQASRDGYRLRAKEVLQKGWWQKLVRSQDFRDYLWAEDNAIHIRDFQLSRMPELLCTQTYVETLAKLGRLSPRYGSLADLLEVQRIRTEIFWRNEAPQAKFLIPEAVFYQRLPEMPSEILREQFKHLQNLASQDGVQIGVLPKETMIHSLLGVTASFTVIDLARWPSFVYFDTSAGAMIAEESATVQHAKVFDRIWHESLDDEESLIFLENQIEALD